MASNRGIDESPSLATEQDLPEGWELTRLADICAPPQYGWTTSAVQNGGGLKLLRTTDISGGSVDWSKVPGCREEPENPEKYLLSPGDIVVSRAGSVGVSYLVKDCPKAIFASYLIRIRPLPPIPSEFIAYFFQSPQYWEAIAEETSGITIPNVNASKLKRLMLPLPPLPEQKRIVAKIEELLVRINATRERLARVPAILKRFRQAVLAAACSGRLTEDWREKHSDMEPAVVLLKRIREFRLNKNEKQKGKPVQIHKSEEPRDSELSELPDSWTWCTVGEIAIVNVGGTPSRKIAQYWRGDIPWVSSGEVANCRITKTVESISSKGLENSNAKIYPKGSVLIAMIGEGKTRGQAAILDIEACTNQNVAGLIFDANSVNAEYVWRWALSEYEQNRAQGRGGNQPALNGQKVRELQLPLPPLKEQDEIVRRLNSLFQLTDVIDRRVTIGVQKTEMVTQAILATAFHGELVPTEAELARREERKYETASELLMRIARHSKPTVPKQHPAERPAEV